MIARWMAAQVRRRNQALWVSCRYMEPFGLPTWAVAVKRMYGPEREIGRGRTLVGALLRALLATRKEGA